MKCSACGASIPQGLSYCPFCRNSLPDSPSSSPSQAPIVRNAGSSLARRRVRLSSAGGQTSVEHPERPMPANQFEDMTSQAPFPWPENVPAQPTEQAAPYAPFAQGPQDGSTFQNVPVQPVEPGNSQLDDFPFSARLPIEEQLSAPVSDRLPWADFAGSEGPDRPQSIEASPEALAWERNARLSSRQMSPGLVASAPERKSPISPGMVGIICVLLIILLSGGFMAVFSLNRNSDLAVTTPTHVAQNTATTRLATTTVAASGTASPTNKITGPSGQSVVPAVAAIFSNVQTTSAIDTNFQPTHSTDTFIVQQSVYITFHIDSRKQAGYIQALWYGNNKLILKDQLSHDPASNVAYFGLTYQTAMDGSAEIYWCTKADYSDAQLAQVVKFKVTQAAS